ncbi:DUF4198 domain-containing protein [Pseudomonas japonica]|uniref:DUF4198 domain-containing protein n=1 Tax=Pseudomonas japonica TaxID=256466 RepID=UPI003818761A
MPWLLAGLLATAGTAQGHGLWTEERRGAIEVVYGHGAEDSAFKAQKIKSAWAWDGQGRQIPVSVERLADHARLQPLRAPAGVAVALDNGPWSQTPDKQWVNEDRSKVRDAISSIHTWKYSLAIYQQGAQLPPLKALRLVIVPQVDPLKVGPGKALPVRVLLDGQPLAGVELVGDYRGAPHQVAATTDSEGRASVVVRNEGLNIIAASVTRPLAKEAPTAEEGLFTSLTFLGEPHHE